MSLSDIFDPIVMAHFRGRRGGSTIDNGYCIRWDGNIAGRECVDLSDLGAGVLYKVSDLVLRESNLIGGFCSLAAGGVNHYQVTDITADLTTTITDCIVVTVEGGVRVISGLAGDYSYLGFMNFSIPSDGTYFLYAVDDLAVFVDLLCHPGTA